MLYELEQLLSKLENNTFYAKETTHAPVDINCEFSPGKMIMESTNHQANIKSKIEIGYSNYYDVISYSETTNGVKTTKSQSEIQSLKDYGLLTNILRHDPRYILTFGTSDKQVGPNAFKIKVYDEDAQEMEDEADDMAMLLGNSAYVEQWARFELDSDDLKEMRIYTKHPKRKKNREKLFTVMDFT